jgi:hypothetical protein
MGKIEKGGMNVYADLGIADASCTFPSPFLLTHFSISALMNATLESVELLSRARKMRVSVP